MKITKDYSKSPAKRFDAVEDVKFWLGNGFEKISRHLSRFTDPEDFQIGCSFVGVLGFPVEAWYDHIHGQGAFRKAWEAKEAGAGSDPNGGPFRA